MVTTLVLTVIGDDRAGLVKALADVVSANGGNWERSHLAELAGKFAGIVLVTVPAERAPQLQDALRPLEGLLDVTVHSGAAGAAGRGAESRGTESRQMRIELLGNDHPGIVQAVSGVLAHHGLNVAELETTTRDAPMAGGRLFEAKALVTVPADADLAALTSDLERIATEIFVDLTLEPAATP